MSTLKLDTLSNKAGTASVPSDTIVSGTAKAWVNFNGTGTVAIRRAFNVSSITDRGTGTYTVNFTNAMADANYCAVITHENIDYGGTSWIQSSAGVTASSIEIASYDNAYFNYLDTEVFCVAVFS